MSGTIHYPLSEQIRDTIDAHGLRWAVAYYAKRLPRYEMRMLMLAAHCYR